MARQTSEDAISLSLLSFLPPSLFPLSPSLFPLFPLSLSLLSSFLSPLFPLSSPPPLSPSLFSLSSLSSLFPLSSPSPSLSSLPLSFLSLLSPLSLASLCSLLYLFPLSLLSLLHRYACHRNFVFKPEDPSEPPNEVAIVTCKPPEEWLPGRRKNKGQWDKKHLDQCKGKKKERLVPPFFLLIGIT